MTYWSQNSLGFFLVSRCKLTGRTPPEDLLQAAEHNCTLRIFLQGSQQDSERNSVEFQSHCVKLCPSLDGLKQANCSCMGKQPVLCGKYAVRGMSWPPGFILLCWFTLTSPKRSEEKIIYIGISFIIATKVENAGSIQQICQHLVRSVV